MMYNRASLIACITPILAWDSPAARADCRFYLADQCDWQGKKGWYLNFEGAERSKMSLILGVADSRDWRFISFGPNLQMGHRYVVRCLLSPTQAVLLVDGKEIGKCPGRWQPGPSRLSCNTLAPWAADVGDWLCRQHNLTVRLSRNGRECGRAQFDFADSARSPVALWCFQPDAPSSGDLAAQPGDTLELTTEFELAGFDLKGSGPFVDRYGQARSAQWPGKVTQDDELRADVATEDAELARTPRHPDYDRYGGYKQAEWKLPPTRYYRVSKRCGHWWLISPEGHPCFYTGMCALPAGTWETTPVSGREFLFEWLPPREGPFGAAWSRDCWGTRDGTEYVCLYTCNLIRKYGADWQSQSVKRAQQRMAAWGFSGGAKWGCVPGFAETPVLGRGGTPTLAGHPDVFDSKVQRVFREDLRRQIEPRRHDPFVVGWSLGNEYDEIIKRSEVVAILAMKGDVPAKRALVDYALERLYAANLSALCAAWKVGAAERQGLYATRPQPPHEDIEKLRRFYADRYYALIYETVKSIDPDHLYMGFWIVPGWWEDQEDWRLIARHCDVIGYDRYAPSYGDERLQKLQAQSDKPTLCGEYSFPAWYNGTRGFGRYGTCTRNDTESGELYFRWVQAAARDPHCLGVCWFFYRDQPLTGRGPGRGARLVFGEHFAFGAIDEMDRPKTELVHRMRQANLQAVRWRLEATSTAPAAERAPGGSAADRR
jgi:hypothetical protein